jgi:uncharacterized membrane protein YcgQ (UPF0703/DUF1980 family)
MLIPFHLPVMNQPTPINQHQSTNTSQPTPINQHQSSITSEDYRDVISYQNCVKAMTGQQVDIHGGRLYR